MKMNRDALNAFLDSDFPEVADMFRVDAARDNALTLRLRPDPAHLRPGGTVSGPTLFGLADVAVYLTILSMIGPKALTVTTNAGMDFMRKPPAGVDLLCETRLLKLGPRAGGGGCLIFPKGDPRPVARASMTYSIPPEG